MKADKAPEKIILSADRDTQIIYDYWVTNDYTNNIKIEYTRTDAFIEKAREWLNKESKSYVKTGGVGACVTYEGLDVKELVEDFEKYMKGEEA